MLVPDRRDAPIEVSGRQRRSGPLLRAAELVAVVEHELHAVVRLRRNGDALAAHADRRLEPLRLERREVDCRDRRVHAACLVLRHRDSEDVPIQTALRRKPPLKSAERGLSLRPVGRTGNRQSAQRHKCLMFHDYVKVLKFSTPASCHWLPWFAPLSHNPPSWRKRENEIDKALGNLKMPIHLPQVKVQENLNFGKRQFKKFGIMCSQ